jgi:hypothetical protein
MYIHSHTGIYRNTSIERNTQCNSHTCARTYIRTKTPGTYASDAHGTYKHTHTNTHASHARMLLHTHALVLHKPKVNMGEAKKLQFNEHEPFDREFFEYSRRPISRTSLSPRDCRREEGARASGIQAGPTIRRCMAGHQHAQTITIRILCTLKILYGHCI